ncbi:MAG: VRR-NUC domain-containing protein [Alteromonadaceae bacterium]|nr:VRR-NUC domain-containing protein [Alteromonadaceae bacterium]
MVKALESSLEKTFNREAAKLKLLSIKLVALSRSGFPDRTVIGRGGLIFFVELKRLGEKAKPHQLYWHRKLRKLGFNVYVIDNKAEAISTFKAEIKAHRKA